MTIYWILLAIPALIGLAYSFEEYPGWVSLGHRVMLFAFAVFYAIVAMLRFEVGGDWGAYLQMYEDIRMSSLGASLSIIMTNPMDVVKTRIQNKNFGETHTSGQIIRALLREEGVTAFFRG